MRKLSALTAALAACAALAAVPTLASGDEVRAAATVKVPDLFDVDAITEESGVPVLLPTRVSTNGIDPDDITPNTVAERGTYSLILGLGPECNGANVCLYAFFYAERGAKRAYGEKVRLRGGRTGFYKPLTCGASCSPPAIQWKYGKVLYEIQFKGASDKKAKATLIKLANSALAAGPR